MISRRILAAAVVLCALVAPAQAQKTKAQLQTEVTTTFPDNASGQITPAGVRTFQNDFINSVMPATNTNIAPGPANTVKGSLDGATTSDLALASCSALYNFTQWVSGSGWQCGINPVLPSRAAAATLNLSAFTSVKTLGYATPGDGGEATFKNGTTNPLIDSYITTFTITAGTGYTPGNYFGVTWSNTLGGKPYAIGTATVSGGGTVTAVSVAGTPGNLCKIGDVYNQQGIPAGTGAQITVTGCSAPLGSFVDAASNNLQIVFNSSFPNILQFGCKGDGKGAGTDGSSTDNFNCIQAASWYAGYNNTRDVGYGGGGWWGNRLIVPQGNFMACGTGTIPLIISNGVWLDFSTSQGSIIKMCDAFSSATNFIELCDPNWQFSCFDTRIMNGQILAARTVSSGAYLVHSNNTQDFGGVYNMYMYSGGRGCFSYDKGYGGASTIFVEKLSCNGNSSSAMIKIGNTVASGLNIGSTIVVIRDTVLGGPSSAPFAAGEGIHLYGGLVTVENVHCENLSGGCVAVDIPSDANKMNARIHNVNEGYGIAGSCPGAIVLTGNSYNGSAIIGQIPPSSCLHIVSNGLSGGTSYDTPIRGDAMFTPNLVTAIP